MHFELDTVYYICQAVCMARAKKSKIVQIRVTPRFYRELKLEANRAGKFVTEWCRETLQAAIVRLNTDPELLALREKQDRSVKPNSRKAK